MMKIWLTAVVVLTVALWTGCATGGGGHNPGPLITVANGNVSNVAVTLTVQFTATVQNSPGATVSWSVKQNNSECSPSCGTISSSGLYTAPATPPGSAAVDVTATLQSDTRFSGKLTITVLPVTVNVTPKLNNGVNIAKGVQQQFTARSLPDDARAQSVTWSLTCDAGANLCGAIDSDGVYTAPNTIPNPATAHVTATSTIDPTGVDTSDIQITPSRLTGGVYAFRLSGFDSGGSPVAVAGNIQTSSNGGIIGGTEDELTPTQHVTRTITGGSLSVDNNVHGTLTLSTSAGSHSYKVAFTADGNGKLIEFDSGGKASGEIVLANSSKFKNSALPAGSKFVFGLAGIDVAANRAGMAGLFSSDGTGGVPSGMLDINDNGVATSSSDVTGSYNIQSDGRGTLSLTNNTSSTTYNYAIYVVAGQTTNDNKPLTLFVISADDPQSRPAVSGTIVFQDPTATYDNSGLNDFFVASLTGVHNNGNTQVSLSTGRGDGAGHVSGIFDANNAGTKVAAQSFTCSYATDTSGRYTLSLLGSGASCSSGVQFVLYATAKSRGFLLDQSSSAVFIGQMDPQPISNLGPSALAGSFAAATVNPGGANVEPVAINFLFTSLLPNFTVSGTQDISGNPSPETLAGTYTAQLDGTGKITLTQPAASEYVMYVLDNPKSADSLAQHFVLINVDSSNTSPAVIFAER